MKRLYYRTIDLFWTLVSKEYRRQDKIAAAIAARYKMSKPFKQARHNGLNPIEALEEYDLFDSQAHQELFPNS